MEATSEDFLHREKDAIFAAITQKMAKGNTTQILMVCLGNICRSPMAYGWLRHRISKRGLDMEVDSAGIANYHTGSAPDSRTCRWSKEYDLDTYDRISIMGHSNLKNVLNPARTEADKQKVSLYLNDMYSRENRKVPILITVTTPILGT